MFLLLSAFGPLAVKALADKALSQKMAYQAKVMAVDEAISNKDYNTWSQLVENQDLKNKINEKNFDQFSQAFELLKIGHVEEVDIIKRQLNLKDALVVATTKSQNIEASIENNDYKTWRALVGKESSQINPKNFDKYTEYYKLLNAGQVEQADKIKVKLGLAPHPMTSYDSAHSGGAVFYSVILLDSGRSYKEVIQLISDEFKIDRSTAIGYYVKQAPSFITKDLSEKQANSLQQRLNALGAKTEKIQDQTIDLELTKVNNFENFVAIVGKYGIDRNKASYYYKNAPITIAKNLSIETANKMKFEIQSNDGGVISFKYQSLVAEANLYSVVLLNDGGRTTEIVDTLTNEFGVNSDLAWNCVKYSPCFISQNLSPQNAIKLSSRLNEFGAANEIVQDQTVNVELTKRDSYYNFITIASRFGIDEATADYYYNNAPITIAQNENMTRANDMKFQMQGGGCGNINLSYKSQSTVKVPGDYSVILLNNGGDIDTIEKVLINEYGITGGNLARAYAYYAPAFIGQHLSINDANQMVGRLSELGAQAQVIPDQTVNVELTYYPENYDLYVQLANQYGIDSDTANYYSKNTPIIIAQNESMDRANDMKFRFGGGNTALTLRYAEASAKAAAQ